MAVQNEDDTSFYTDTTTTVVQKSVATECLPPANPCETPTDKHTSTVSSQTDFSSVHEGSDSEVWCCGIRKRRKAKDYRLLTGRSTKSSFRSPFSKLTDKEKKTFIDLINEPVTRPFRVTYDQLESTESDSDSESGTEDDETTAQGDITEDTSMCTESKCHCDHIIQNHQLPRVVTNQYSTSCYAAQHNTAVPDQQSYGRSFSWGQDDRRQSLNWESNMDKVEVPPQSSCKKSYQESIVNYANHTRCNYDSSGLVFAAKASIERFQFAAETSKQTLQHEPAPQNFSSNTDLIANANPVPQEQTQDSANSLDDRTSQSNQDVEGQPTMNASINNDSSECTVCNPTINKVPTNQSEPPLSEPSPSACTSPDISETIQVSEKLSTTLHTAPVFPWKVQGCGSPFKGGLVAASRVEGSREKTRTDMRVGQRLRIVPKNTLK